MDKACFQHDTHYGNSKDLNRRTTADKLSCYKAFNIAKNSKYDGYQRGIVPMVYEFLIKFKDEMIFNKELAGRVYAN